MVDRITPDLGHDEVAALLGAYALDAVEPHEARAVRLHVADCPRCRGELDEHLDVVGRLGDAGGPAPAGLWDRIEADLEAPGATGPPPGPPAVPGPRPTAPTSARWARRALPVLAAAAAVVAIALLGVNAVNQADRIDDLTAQVDEAGKADQVADLLAQPGTQVVTLATPEEDHSIPAVVHTDTTSFLIAETLPDAGEGSTYQLWGRTADGLVSLGVLGRDPDTVGFTVDAGTEALLITREKAGGSPEPTELPRLRGDLTSA